MGDLRKSRELRTEREIQSLYGDVDIPKKEMETRARKKQRIEEGKMQPTGRVGPVPDRGSINAWGIHGKGDGQFGWPIGLAAGIDGVIYVVDYYNYRIQCFAANGTFIHKWGKWGKEDGEFIRIRGIAVGVCDGMNKSILQKMCETSELCAFPPGILPLCASYIGNECIYVCDGGNHRMQVFMRGDKSVTETKFIRKWNIYGDIEGELCEPCSCAIDVTGRRAGAVGTLEERAGLIYITDCSNNLQVFTSEGIFIRRWKIPRFCKGISINNNGILHVPICNSSIIQRYHLNGTLIDQLDIQQNILLGYSTIDDNEVIYVSDFRDRILQLGFDGTVLKEWKDTVSKGDEFNYPCGLARGLSGVLYVADSNNHRIVAINTRD